MQEAKLKLFTERLKLEALPAQCALRADIQAQQQLLQVSIASCHLWPTSLWAHALCYACMFKHAIPTIKVACQFAHVS